jgi:hypothetical protein
LLIAISFNQILIRVDFNGELTTIATGNVGMSPGTSITGNYDVTGSTEINSTPANQCASDRRVAYDSLKAAKCGAIRNELGGQKLEPGVYCDSGSSDLTLSSDLELTGEGEFIFQASSNFMSTLNTKIILSDGAKAENIFWVVGKSVTLGTSSQFVGTIIADAAIGFQTKATVNGQALAGTAVTYESSNYMVNPNVPTKESQAVLKSKSTSDPISVGECKDFAVHGGTK